MSAPLNRTELINFLKVLMQSGVTIEQAIELLEKAKGAKKIGRLKEKQIIRDYEKR
jgi:type II secretory pathway component PulF